MIVLGVDPSVKATGVAMMDLEPFQDGARLLNVQTWRGLWNGAAPAAGDVAGERRRIRFQLREALAFVPDRVDLTVIEGPAIHARFPAKGDERAGLRWLLIDQLLARGPVAIVDPRTRALLATGSGAAKKAAVTAAMRTRFPGVRVPDDNVADAMALAEAGAVQMGFRSPYTSEKQVSAHVKVAWPIEGELLLAGMRK